MTLTWPDGSCHRSCLSLSSDIGSLFSLLAFCFKTHWHYFIRPEPFFFAGPMGATVKALGGSTFLAAPSAFYQPWRWTWWPCVACGTPSLWKPWGTVFPVALRPVLSAWSYLHPIRSYIWKIPPCSCLPVPGLLQRTRDLVVRKEERAWLSFGRPGPVLKPVVRPHCGDPQS